MTLKVRHVLRLLAWGGVAYGVLLIGTIPGDFGHFLCGSWG